MSLELRVDELAGRAPGAADKCDQHLGEIGNAFIRKGKGLVWLVDTGEEMILPGFDVIRKTALSLHGWALTRRAQFHATRGEKKYLRVEEYKREWAGEDGYACLLYMYFVLVFYLQLFL